MWPNAKISVMGPDQLSSVMQTVSGKRNQAEGGAEDRFADLRAKIEAQTSALYSTARIWVSSQIRDMVIELTPLCLQDDGIIAPSDTRDVLGLGLDLAADETASRENGGSGKGMRGEVGADGDAGDWGVFRM